MADDQNSNKVNIDDLVRELSKNSSTPPSVPKPPPASQTSGPSLPPLKPMAPPSIPPKPPVQSVPTAPKPSEVPKPQFNTTPPVFNQPKPPIVSQPQVKPTSPLPSSVAVPPPPVSGSSAIPPSSTSGVKEYQSSIRTMNEDISKIKQGQKPMSVYVPRKIEQVVPTPTPPVGPPKPPPVSGPSQQFKVPAVNLGEAQKTGPMTPSKEIPKPPVPPKQEIAKPQIYIPQDVPKSGNRNTLFISLAVLAVLAGLLYWFFVLRSPAPEVVIESPTPTPTETPTPTPTPTLASIFSGIQKQEISIKPKNPLASFVLDIMNGKFTVDSGTFKFIEAFDLEKSSVSYSFDGLITKLGVKVPVGIINNLDEDSKFFIYGQKEAFDANGIAKAQSLTTNRILLIAEIKSPNKLETEQALVQWETSMGNDFKELFSLGKTNKNQTGFLSNQYKGVNIKYWNFPYPDKAIDYAVVVASNNKSYLVIANSREAIYATVDKLKSN